MFYKNLVLITSAICVSQKPLSYTKQRSPFSHDERLNQTIESIQSIRLYIPNVYIILIDATIEKREWKTLLDEQVDIFLDLSKNERILKLTNECPHKGVAECEQLLTALEYLSTINISFENMFKLTGRYKLTSSFELEYFENNDIIFKYVPDPKTIEYKTHVFKKNPNTKMCYTFFYKIPFCHLELYKNALKDTTNKGLRGLSIENILPFLLPNVKYIDSLGVVGCVVSTSKLFVEFDWEIYFTSNPELFSKGICQKQSIIDYWNNHGNSENILITSNKKRCLVISQKYHDKQKLENVFPNIIFIVYSNKKQLEECNVSKVAYLHIIDLPCNDITQEYMNVFTKKNKDVCVLPTPFSN